MNQTLSGQAKGRRRIFPVAALLLCATLFAALGTWQVKRLAWKEALIAHVNAVSTAAPVDAAKLPSAPDAAMLDDLEYRQVSVSGRFDPAGTTLVSALTELGAGYWVLAPLRLEDGRAIWINRGYVPLGSTRGQQATLLPASTQSLIGLLRKSEAPSNILRANQPEAERWYFRNLPQIAAKARVKDSGTIWFIDAKAESAPAKGQPIAGLTVIAFPNNHLPYAITWFGLCAMCFGGIWLVLRHRG
jgi:surfeit locus 1 family protein